MIVLEMAAVVAAAEAAVAVLVEMSFVVAGIMMYSEWQVQIGNFEAPGTFSS